MCNINNYNNFDELPNELKSKYKGSNNCRSKQTFCDFINKLNEHGHILVGDYINFKTKTLVDYNCIHGIREVTYNSYRDHPRCLLCFQEEQKIKTKEHFDNMSLKDREAFKKKMTEVNREQWNIRKQDKDFMDSFCNSIKNGMDAMDEERKQERKDNISNTWANKTDEERKQFYLEHGGTNSPQWKGTSAITDYCRNLVRKKDILSKNNYTCQLTGKTGRLAIHHIYSFNLMIQDAHKINNIEIKKTIDLYSKEELKLIENYVIRWHDDECNYIVILEEIHKQFHKIYGNGNNTREQWLEFISYEWSDSKWV